MNDETLQKLIKHEKSARAIGNIAEADNYLRKINAVKKARLEQRSSQRVVGTWNCSCGFNIRSRHRRGRGWSDDCRNVARAASPAGTRFNQGEINFMPIDFDNLKTDYPFACAACGHEQNARPSMMMKIFGKNSGCGDCLKCGEFLHLEIDEAGERMTSILWDEYLAQTKTVKI